MELYATVSITEDSMQSRLRRITHCHVIGACHDSLGGNTYFSSLDMRSGYWRVPVSEQDIDKTCFVTWKGIFGFRVLLFGLCNAPSTFQHLVDMALAVLTWEVCLAYLDDLVIFSSTFE